jgi:hypothetical protein
MFTAMRKKYAKLTAFRTIKRRNGRMRAVSTRACPELPLKCLDFLITTTSSYPHGKSLPVAVFAFHIGKRHFWFFLELVLRNLVGANLELVKQSM